MIKKIIAAVIMSLFAIQVFAATIWKDSNVYSSEGRVNTGDVLVVHVRDFSNLKFTLNLNNNSSSDISSNPDITITGFLPKVASNKSYTSKEATSFNGNSKIELSIAARVTGLQQNRFAVISGSRTYVFNGVTNRITISGLVDPALISSRTIDSDYISNFRIQIAGQKEGLTIRKARIPAGESASSELTEQEKQRIIIDYLEKIIREITR